MENNIHANNEPAGSSPAGKEGLDVPLAVTDPEQDGRNKEWEDRARVNVEVVPEGVNTNIERDFEPEQLGENDETSHEANPAY